MYNSSLQQLHAIHSHLYRYKRNSLSSSLLLFDHLRNQYYPNSINQINLFRIIHVCSSFTIGLFYWSIRRHALAPELSTTSGAHDSAVGGAAHWDEANAEHVAYSHLASTATAVATQAWSGRAASYLPRLVAQKAAKHGC